MEIHDIKTGYSTIVGYSIKSELGNSPTLLNASYSSNFRFVVSGLTDSEVITINSIATKAKIRDRICAIERIGGIEYDGPANADFSGNLILIDSRMEEIVAAMLIEYYKNGIINCSDIATVLEEKDPMEFHRDGIYRFKIKKLLCAIALGMTPAKKWDGQDEANGGYIIVKESGEVVAYHLYNRNSFENYLLNNTKLETPSTGRHKFGSIYTEDGKRYINLNLQIRFV